MMKLSVAVCTYWVAGALCGAAVFKGLHGWHLPHHRASPAATRARQLPYIGEAPPAPRRTPPAPPVLRWRTTRGDFDVLVNASKCPRSARQLRRLVASGFLDQHLGFWRVNKWITQFGADKSPGSRKRDGEADPFAAVRASHENDAHPDCAANASAPCAGGAPWARGDLALIGATALLFVRAANADMGRNRHDCPVGRVLGDGAARVLDALDDSYGNMIDTKSGRSQRAIFKDGLDGLLRDFPKTDLLWNVSWATELPGRRGPRGDELVP